MQNYVDKTEYIFYHSVLHTVTRLENYICSRIRVSNTKISCCFFFGGGGGGRFIRTYVKPVGRRTVDKLNVYLTHCQPSPIYIPEINLDHEFHLEVSHSWNIPS